MLSLLFLLAMSLKNTKSKIYMCKIVVKISTDNESDDSSQDYKESEIEGIIFLLLLFELHNKQKIVYLIGY